MGGGRGEGGGGGGGEGVSGIPMSLISIFESYLSFSFVFQASPNIHANESKAGGSSGGG